MNKKYQEEGQVLSFYRNNLGSLLLTLEIWTVFYFLMLRIPAYRPDIQPTLRELVNYLFFVQNIPFRHIWYVPMILGLYTIIPFMAMIEQAYSLKALAVPILFGVVLNIVLPSVNAALLLVSPNSGGGYFFAERRDYRRRLCDLFVAGFLCRAAAGIGKGSCLGVADIRAGLFFVFGVPVHEYGVSYLV